MGYYRKSDEEYNLRVYLTEDLGLDVYEDLVREVEILEDNTEEIEELPIELLNEQNPIPHIIKQHNKINEIIRYIKRKDKSND